MSDKGTSLRVDQFDHLGIPTDQEKPGAVYLPNDGVWITNPREHPANVEWVRHTHESRMPERLRKEVHMAYRVDDLSRYVSAYEVLVDEFLIPESQVTIAFVEIDGVIVELLCSANLDKEEWVV